MARKPKPPEPPADLNRWLGTYGDLVTLLMAFFVMLFATSDANPVKFESFVQGLAGPFDNPGTVNVLGGDGVEQSAEGLVELLVPSAPGPADVANAAVQGGGGQPVGQDGEDERGSGEGEGGELTAQLASVEGQIESAIAGTDIPVSADVRDDERGLVVAISTDDVLFETGSAVLSEDGRRFLDVLGPILAAAPNTIVVEGHTDDRPLRRGGYSNWNLSTDRAIAVVDLLGATHGLPWSRMAATGYGEHRPLVGNDSEEGRAVNRRVEILIVALDVPGQDEGAPPPGPAVVDFSERLPATSIASVLDGG